MRILVLTQLLVYPADAGPKIKTLHVLQHLARDHTVVYSTFIRNIDERQRAEKLPLNCRRVATVLIKRSRLSDLRFLLVSLISGDAFLLRRDERAAMYTTVRQLLAEEQIDVVHVDQLNMLRFVPEDWPGRVVLDEHNAVWQVVDRLRQGQHNLLLRWFLSRETRLVRKIEGQACRRADAVLAVSEQDRQALQEVSAEDLPITVVPITIDVTRFTSIWEMRAPQPQRILTVGTMFWAPNSEGVSWWLRTGYDQLRLLFPALTYDIVGPRPPRSLRALAARHQGVRLHGYVADTAPFWTSATVLVVPLLSGGGVRVKILEAMVYGVPVISTTIGCEGLAVRDGVHLLIADTPSAFVDACARLFQDQELARFLAQNARQLVLEHYDAKTALKRLDEVYAQLDPAYS